MMCSKLVPMFLSNNLLYKSLYIKKSWFQVKIIFCLWVFLYRFLLWISRDSPGLLLSPPCHGLGCPPSQYLKQCCSRQCQTSDTTSWLLPLDPKLPSVMMSWHTEYPAQYLGVMHCPCSTLWQPAGVGDLLGAKRNLGWCCLWSCDITSFAYQNWHHHVTHDQGMLWHFEGNLMIEMFTTEFLLKY